jgi:hypothetical protein
MKSITKASRVNTAIQVIQYMNAGMTVVEACKAVGMPRSSFYYIMDNNPDTLAEAQELIDISNREQLGLILLSKTELLRKVIQDGLSEATKPKDRLAIYLRLNDLVDQLSNTLQIESQVDKEAHEFLKHGPQLVMAKSRFIATERTVTIESES